MLIQLCVFLDWYYNDLTLFVVYLLVLLAYNFAKKDHLPGNHLPPFKWRLALKEGKKFLKAKYDVKVKSLKRRSTLLWRRSSENKSL